MTSSLTIDIVDPGRTAPIQEWYGVKLTPSPEHWNIFEKWVTSKILTLPGWDNTMSHSLMRDCVEKEMLDSYNAKLIYYVSRDTGSTIGARVVFPDLEQLTIWVLQWS
ncbi:hypothetical protein UFOVP29_14 [uncultured Caudovirales phage]|uniref:Uncharacterized protein n=1 Tax=uncultured Caudovirales phage TaxID=2100421 RepID=A0A6J5KLS0_9CAUD|nr:hypothetical protein UFOVP29_14 [uncultured Caudovirales phage]